MKSKIGPGEWKILYAVSGAIDLLQIVIDFFVVGVVINEVLDVIIGIVLVIYFQLRGVNMFKHPSRILSLLGVAALEEFTGGFAPAWIVDIWYIHRSVKQNEGGAEPEIPKGVTPARNPRQPVNITPGVRPPRLPTKLPKMPGKIG